MFMLGFEVALPSLLIFSLAKGMKQKELLAKLQTTGIEISTPALSLLEGQKRPVTDYELNALADILGVSVDWLLGREEK